MSMVVKNNMSAVHTLNTLNQNSSALQKSLQKVSSGMKINSAQDDASGYAISEKMRVQIRSLDQANANTQNASSMIKTAEGAVQTTLDIVRTMKEKAINAATDTNTDSDRLTIQKELDQFIDQVDDNALTTFNGKILLDGSSMPVYDHDYAIEQNIVRGLNSAWITDALELIKDSYGMDFESGPNNNAAAKYLDVKFYTDDTSTTVASCGSSYGGDTVTLNVNLGAVQKLETTGQDGQDGVFYLDEAGTQKNGQSLDRVIAHELTHGVMINRFKDFDSLPSYIIEGGSAELVHGADSRVKADTSYMANSDTFKSQVFDATGTGAAAGSAYDGGYVAMRYFAATANINPADAMLKFMTAMDKGATVDEAFNTASAGKYENRAAFETALLKDLGDGSNSDTFLTNIGINTTNEDTGAITGKDAGGKLVKTGSSVVHEVGSTVNWRLPTSTTTVIGGLQVRWPEGMNVSNSAGGSTVFQVGASANQSMNIGFNDMRAKAIGLYGEDGEKLDITTQPKARAAISTLDKVVNLVVDQQTNIGAMLQRLDYTSANLTTSSENVQAAESVIRDSDMAKEMTAYTKNNVLMQAAQSMLAQANQSSSQVLSLLQ